MRVAGADEVREQRMRTERLGTELWVKLHRNEPRMIRQLDRFDELAIWRAAGKHESVVGECRFVGRVEFVPMSVSLLHLVAAVDAVGLRAGHQLTGIGAKPHRAAQVIDAQ